MTANLCSECLLFTTIYTGRTHVSEFPEPPHIHITELPWIIVERGHMFEGTVDQFEDCFGGGASVEAVQHFAESNDCEWLYLTDEAA